MARAPRRVSLKGKGADIFFGDYAPPGTVAEEPAVDTVELTPELEGRPEEISRSTAEPTVQAADAPDMQARKQESLLASKEESKQGRKQARLQESLQRSQEGNREGRAEASRASGSPEQRGAGPGAVVAGDVTEEIWVALDQPATITNSFRYLESELDGVADVLYEIGKAQGVKLTKQEVARLGLNVVLDDYRRRGPASLLSQLAARRQHRSGRH